MKKTIFLLFIFLCVNCFATTKSQAIKIYYRIIQANGMKHYPKLAFSSDPSLNAHEGGGFIVINKGMLKQTNINQLAFVIGHELSHFRLNHQGSNHKNEYAADKLGYYMSKKAGYNPHKGKSLFKKFKQASSKTHPHPKNRYRALP